MTPQAAAPSPHHLHSNSIALLAWHRCRRRCGRRSSDASTRAGFGRFGRHRHRAPGGSHRGNRRGCRCGNVRAATDMQRISSEPAAHTARRSQSRPCIVSAVRRATRKKRAWLLGLQPRPCFLSFVRVVDSLAGTSWAPRALFFLCFVVGRQRARDTCGPEPWATVERAKHSSRPSRGPLTLISRFVAGGGGEGGAGAKLCRRGRGCGCGREGRLQGFGC